MPLLIAPRLRWQHAALAALCAGASAGLNLWHYLCGVIGPVITGVLVAVEVAVKFAICKDMVAVVLLPRRRHRENT